MDLKNLMSQVVRPVNRTTTEELPAMQELAQLSEEEMQQIWGGGGAEAEGEVLGIAEFKLKKVNYGGRFGVWGYKKIFSEIWPGFPRM